MRGNENKVILRDYNCTMDKLIGMVKIKTQRLHRCSSLSKLIVDNGPDSPESARYNRSFGKDPG